MPRVMVISEEHSGASVLLDEHVSSVHLDSEHSAWQFVERLGWAISDAEDGERVQQPRSGPGREREPAVRPLHGRSRVRAQGLRAPRARQHTA